MCCVWGAPSGENSRYLLPVCLGYEGTGWGQKGNNGWDMYLKKWVATTFLQVADQSYFSDICARKPCGDEPTHWSSSLRASSAWLGVETGEMKKIPQSSLCCKQRTQVGRGLAWGIGEIPRNFPARLVTHARGHGCLGH